MAQVDLIAALQQQRGPYRGDRAVVSLPSYVVRERDTILIETRGFQWDLRKKKIPLRIIENGRQVAWRDSGISIPENLADLAGQTCKMFDLIS